MLREDEESYEDELRREEAARPPRVIDERMFGEPIRIIPRRSGAVSVEQDATVAEAIRRMQEHRTGCVLVTEGGTLSGIFTERDILAKLLGTAQDLAAIRVESVMTREPEALTPDDAVAFAMHLMSVGGFRHVPLVDAARRPVGIISVKDVIDYLVEFFPRQVYNLPPRPGKDHARVPEGA
jgi:CBS domain-containing protein